MKTAAVLSALGLLAVAPATGQDTPRNGPMSEMDGGCPVTARHLVANDGLKRSRAAVAAGRLTILAVGSSSIEGAGASRPEVSFVGLLGPELERRLPGVSVMVLNGGIGGETAKETADRIEGAVAMTRPDLVLWQLGTNDVLRDRPMADVLADFRRGRAVLDAAGVDVLLIDPQRLRDHPDNPGFMGRNPMLGETARLIDDEARMAGYAVLHRFAAMDDWMGLERGGIGPDDLHLNDQGYACWAAVSAEGLAMALR